MGLTKGGTHQRWLLHYFTKALIGAPIDYNSEVNQREKPMTRFFDRRFEDLVLLRDLVFCLAPRISSTARKLSSFADYEGQPWCAVRASAAYWLCTGGIWDGGAVPLRTSIAWYMRTGDTEYYNPLSYSRQKDGRR